MTTTVKQLIEWLKTQDENKPIHVMREYHCGGYMGYATEFVDLVIPDEHDYSPNADVYDTWISFGER
jgi:hypothetical protein